MATLGLPEVTKKRRYSEDDHDSGRRKVLREDPEPFNLIDFSDEILMIILQNLDSIALINLSRSCHRFHNLAADKTLWSHVDLSAEPLRGQQIANFIFEDVCRYGEIRSLKLRGLVSLHPLDQWKDQTVPVRFLKALAKRCPHLESISISEGCFDVSKVMVVRFPKWLKEFNVDRCEIICTEIKGNRRDMSFFTGINKYMDELEKLKVENCNWFDTHDLIAFSKLPNLKILSLRGCNTFKECVPYGSIATRFGFKTLEVLDVRNTPVTDSDIQCFNMTKSLRELRLQCPEIKEKSELDAVPPSAAEPGPSGEPPSQPTDTPPSLERQVINLHFRRVLENDQVREPDEIIDPPQNVAANANGNNVNIHVAAGPGAENNENGAEFQAGNNVRINIRNQNVQGRNVIHIVVRNNHQCNNRPAGAGANDGEQPAENAAEEAAPNNPEPNENPVAPPQPEAVNNPQPAGGGQPAGEQGEFQRARETLIKQLFFPKGAQHYIMIRGFRENAPDDGDDVNPARIVQ